MKRIVLFSPGGYIGGFIKAKIERIREIQLYEVSRSSDLEQYEGDYDILIYSAAVSNATTEKLLQDNVGAAINMMRFSREHHVKRVIYLSSDSVYGELNTDIVTEDTIMVNPNVYGVTKYLAEKVILESGIPYYILRMPGVVGRVWRDVFICNTISKIKEGEHLRLYNIDRLFNNILHIDDLITFIILLCEREDMDDKQIFLLGNTELVKLKEILVYIKEFYHSGSLICSEDTDQKRYFTLDVTKAIQYGYVSKGIKNIIEELCRLKEREVL
ncbi:MAG: NAD(P)-dependent oxidoreductase [Kineothrix sp.]|nr:NAD(P)-dependent oxidoreductase [Kineothrix sp.]